MDVRKLPKASGDVPTMAVNASLSRLMASVNTGKPLDGVHASKGDFIPAKTFQGARAGYFFSTGNRGVGYYSERGLNKQETESRKRKEREGQKVTLNAEDLLKKAEENAKQETELDSKTLKKLTASFEKKYTENLEQRMKHPNDPEKFMDSEIDLDDAVQDLFVLVNSPDLYPVFVECNISASLLHLLLHENRDISADVVQFLASITDTTDNEEWIKEFSLLSEVLNKSSASDLLIQLLLQLNESSEEEAHTVFNILTVLDNLMDIQPQTTHFLAGHEKFIAWLLKRISRFEFDSNKQLCGELLVELLQQEQESLLKDSTVFDVLFHFLKQTCKSQSGEAEDELELLENIFDALCCCLLAPEIKIKFAEEHGVELALEIIKRRRSLRHGSLKVIEFATSQCPVACEHLVAAYGLKTVFSFFMGKMKTPDGKDSEEQRKIEEISLTIISSLFQELQKGSIRQRVAAKFVENEFEKSDHLLELYFIYEAQVVAADDNRSRTEGIEMDQEESLAQRLAAGLAALQHICLIVCYLWHSGDKSLRQRLLLLLHQKRHTLESVKTVVSEMADMMGGKEEESRQRLNLQKLLANMEIKQQEDDVGENGKEDRILTKEELRRRISKKRKTKEQEVG